MLHLSQDLLIFYNKLFVITFTQKKVKLNPCMPRFTLYMIKRIMYNKSDATEWNQLRCNKRNLCVLCHSELYNIGASQQHIIKTVFKKEMIYCTLESFSASPADKKKTIWLQHRANLQIDFNMENQTSHLYCVNLLKSCSKRVFFSHEAVLWSLTQPWSLKSYLPHYKVKWSSQRHFTFKSLCLSSSNFFSHISPTRLGERGIGRL